MAKKRILYAEDDEAVRDSTAFLLDMEDYDVVACANGTQALAVYKAAVAAAEPFDLVMTDYDMPLSKGVPGMNGVKLAEEIRKVDRSIPIIMRSGTPIEDIQEENPNFRDLNIIYSQKNIGSAYLELIQSQIHRRDRGDAAPAV